MLQAERRGRVLGQIDGMPTTNFGDDGESCRLGQVHDRLAAAVGADRERPTDA